MLEPASTARPLIGRVVSTWSVNVPNAHVPTRRYYHLVEARDGPGTQVMVVTYDGLCPVQGDAETTYQMSLREGDVRYRLSNEDDMIDEVMNGTGQTGSTNLTIVSCAPIDSP